MLRPLWVALQLLTVLPTPRLSAYDPRDQGWAVVLYPLVGALLGALLVAAARLAVELGATAEGPAMLLSAALLLALWQGLSGGLHLDGFADSWDAWVGSHRDPQRAMEIMRDPACGPMAVGALLILLLIKFAAVAVLLKMQAWGALAGVPLAARALLPALFLTTPYVRRNGLGADAARCLPRPAGWLSLTLSGLVLIELWGLHSLWLMVGLGLLLALWRRVLLRWIGGTTGDTAGALVESAETVALVGLALAVALTG